MTATARQCSTTFLCRVPASRLDDLAHYDGSVIAERAKGELSARCDKEAANFLAINLANDVMTGRRSVADARAFYARAIKLLMSGKMHPYSTRFVFDTPDGWTGSPDERVISEEAMKRMKQ